MTDSNSPDTSFQPSHLPVLASERPAVSPVLSRSRAPTLRTPTSPASLRREPTLGFHDDFSFHANNDDADLTDIENEDHRAKEDGTARGYPTTTVNHDEPAKEEVEKRESYSPDDDRRDMYNLDLESGTESSLSRQTTVKSTRSVRSQAFQDPNLVSWSGPGDPENPKNWSLKRKWAAVAIVSAFEFISPLASSMVAPALPSISADLSITSPVLSQMSLSIFVLAYAVGPLFLGPLSELYGRVPVLQLANIFFLTFNLGCGFAQNVTQLLVCRFFAGLGGSAPLAVGGGVLSDCFTADKRGQAVAIYVLMPVLGPAVGPIAGGFITTYSTWRWAFWSVAIADAVIQGFGLLFLQETWAPKLLEQKSRRLKKQTGNDALYPLVSNTQISFGQKMRKTLSRPFILLFTQPIIAVLCLYRAYLYGLTYLVISTFSSLYTSPEYYNESIDIAGLHYIALALGYMLGSQLTGRFNDWVYCRLKRRNNNVGKPEFRAPVLMPCAVLLPIGFLLYGWSAQQHLPWIVTDIGACILGAATLAGNQATQSYTIDAYSKYAASAVAVTSCLRSLAGFGFPLFAPALYDALGYGWGNSLLAFIAIAIGGPAPWVFWRYGEGLRRRSRYAAGE